MFDREVKVSPHETWYAFPFSYLTFLGKSILEIKCKHFLLITLYMLELSKSTIAVKPMIN